MLSTEMREQRQQKQKGGVHSQALEVLWCLPVVPATCTALLHLQAGTATAAAIKIRALPLAVVVPVALQWQNELFTGNEDFFFFTAWVFLRQVEGKRTQACGPSNRVCPRSGESGGWQRHCRVKFAAGLVRMLLCTAPMTLQRGRTLCTLPPCSPASRSTMTHTAWCGTSCRPRFHAS